MSTLHLYHWKSTDDLKSRIDLINQNDSLLIIGEVNQQEVSVVEQTFSNRSIQWYLVKQQNKPHISQNVISHDDWLKLILNHQNCFAWK